MGSVNARLGAGVAVEQAECMGQGGMKMYKYGVDENGDPTPSIGDGRMAPIGNVK